MLIAYVDEEIKGQPNSLLQKGILYPLISSNFLSV